MAADDLGRRSPADDAGTDIYWRQATNLAGNGVVLFGGLSPSGAVLGDLSIWDGTN